MALLERLAQLDSAMQRGLDNSMAFVFGGKVVPEEIEELLKQELEDHLTVVAGTWTAPNILAVGVSSKDLENLSRDPHLPETLSEQTARFVRNQSWSLAGPLVIRIAEESGLRTGQLRISSFVDPDPEESSGFDAIFHDDSAIADAHAAHSQAPAAATASSTEMDSPMNATDAYTNPSDGFSGDDAATTTFHRPEAAAAADETQIPEPAVTLLLQDGSSRTYHVHMGSNIIGRSTEAHLRLPDTGVSRQHAELVWNGHDAILVDLQSTNGTTVNDTPIDNWLLADGDVITMGHSHIEVRITGMEF